MAKRTRKSQEVSSEAAIVEGVIKAIGHLAMLVWKALGKGDLAPTVTTQARQQLRDGWEQVEFLIIQPGTAGLAVSEADKLLDAGLKLIGAKGETMGERLKMSEHRFTAELYNRIWQAHKLRNQLAHEVGAQTKPQEAKAAVATMREALNGLNLI